MLTVKAKHWVKDGAGWHEPGEVFAVLSATDINDMVEVVSGTEQSAEGETAERPVEPPKRTRKRKAED